MGRDKSNGLFGRVGALTFHGYRFPFSLNRMCSIWRDAFRIPQLTLLSLPPPKDVKHLVRTLQNESLSNALETFSTDREGQIKLVIDFFTFVSWILRLLLDYNEYNKRVDISKWSVLFWEIVISCSYWWTCVCLSVFLWNKFSFVILNLSCPYV